MRSGRLQRCAQLPAQKHRRVLGDDLGGAIALGATVPRWHRAPSDRDPMPPDQRLEASGSRQGEERIPRTTDLDVHHLQRGEDGRRPQRSGAFPVAAAASDFLKSASVKPVEVRAAHEDLGGHIARDILQQIF